MPDRPITPSRVFPAGEPLPAPAAPPPPPPPPPPAAPPATPDWFGPRFGPSGPPPPIPVDVHVTVTIDQGGWLAVPDPEPLPRWYQRIRWGYNIG
ncbi:hypothetical protein, partial [Streptomyces leeuwenhoekii]|uniref:hypothetical protein n=1 Tax=Streptomyces leeuwenhoekii TaxID=1437453 RepID=UPI000AA305EF